MIYNCRIGLQVRRTGSEERWRGAVMSQDECDFEVGDHGNRGPTTVGWPADLEWVKLSEV